MKKKNREKFSSKLGFILSCIGAAVGLGNIWMFSYKLGENGGGAFLIPYFIFVFLLGTTGLITEFAFGRAMGSGSMTGIKRVFKEKNIKGGNILSIIPTITLTGIFLFYTIVVGWIFKYFTISVTGKINNINITKYFGNFVGSNESIIWHAIAIIITLGIVILGVSKGIEKINKIMMPGLFLIFILLTIRSLTLPGAEKGIMYLLTPKWEYLLKVKTWIMALGQAFFTVSLTGCALVAYGSYTEKNVDLPSSAIKTTIFDTLAAVLASLVIIPAVFAYGLDPSAGPALLFITVPTIFKSMPFGMVLSSIFFLSIIFASLSSSIVMLEGPVEAVMSEGKLNRKKASILVALLCFLLAIPLDVNMNLFSKFSDFITIILTPIGILIVVITFYYVYGKEKALKEINTGAVKPLGKVFLWFAKYVFAITIIIVIILGIIYGGIG